MERSTRSGKTFAQWEEPVIVSRNADFNFPQLVRKATALEDALSEAIEDMEDYPLLPSSPENTDSESERIVGPLLEETGDGHAEVLESARIIRPFPEDTGNADAETTDAEETAHQRRKRKKRAREHIARNKKRQEDRTFSRHTARPAVQDKYVKTAVPIFTAQNLTDTKNVASTGWVGLDDRVRDEHEYTLEELVGPSSKFNFEYVEWKADVPIPIVSREGILIAILAGKPDTAEWPRLAREAAELLHDANKRCRVPESAHLHRRGAFVALQTGVSHGGGQKRPCNLRSGSRTNAKILHKLNNAEPFRRLAGFATSVMAHWAPDLHDYYSTHLAQLRAKYPSLKWIFPFSVFAASSYNLGPRTVCFKHTDFGNLPFGLCAVTAFGNYNPTKGGHLVLWDCKLVIEFPPGATILLPSATLAHSNVPVAEHESRFSFAQYTAGALFRWVRNDFQKGTDFVASLSQEELAEKIKEDQNRWAFGLSLLPSFEIPSNL